MGSVARRPDGSWRARVKGPDGKERARHFGTKLEAHRWISVTETDVLRGTWVDPDAAKTTFGVYVEGWVAAQLHHSPGTVDATAYRLKNHVLPTFEHRALGSVRPSDVQAWVQDRAGELAPSTVAVVYGLVAQIFRAAVSDGLLVRSPCRGVKLPRVEAASVEIPSVEAVAAIAGALPDRTRAAVWLGAGAGLRLGEVLGLTVDRVDWLRRAIRVDRQLQTRLQLGPVLCPPKTRASVRSIPVDDTLLELLAEHVADHGEGPDRLLLTNGAGRAWRSSSWGEVWRKATSAADAGGLRFHALRHLYASLLIHRGQSPKVIQARLGHANIAETFDTYGHLWPDDEDATRAAVADLLGPVLEVREKSAIARTSGSAADRS